VVKAILGITQSATRTAAALTNAMEGWKALSHIWKADREATIAKLQVCSLEIICS